MVLLVEPREQRAGGVAGVQQLHLVGGADRHLELLDVEVGGHPAERRALLASQSVPALRAASPIPTGIVQWQNKTRLSWLLYVCRLKASRLQGVVLSKLFQKTSWVSKLAQNINQAS